MSGGGRGLNVVLVDPLTLQPTKALRFDTYASESPALETFLQEQVVQKQVVPGHLVILLTFDEASRNLSSHARSLIAQLGSGQIQNLGYRDQWYMIGQAGILGFTPYEQVVPSSQDSNISVALCLPRRIEGTIIQPDSTLFTNDARAAFCSDKRHLKHFCAVGVEYDPVGVCESPVSRTLETSPLLSTPVLVLGDTDLTTLALTLETLAAQSGLDPRMVVVALNPSTVPDAVPLVKLFNFTVLPIPDAGSRAEFVERGLEHVAEHAARDHVVVVEEGCLLSPDFFPYLAATMPLLADPTAMAVSAWNPNGYSGINGRQEVVMRVSEAPGVAFLVSRLTLTRHLLHNIRSCCRGRGWEGWQSWVAGGWVVVPEVSRVLVRPASPHLQRAADRPLVRQLFYRLRRTSVRYVEVQGVDELRGDRYIRLLSSLLRDGASWRVSADEVHRCAQGQQQLRPPSGNSSVLVVAFKERAAGVAPQTSPWQGLVLLCRCFGLFDPGDSGTPKGLYQGIIRFSVGDREVLLLHHRSPLFAGSRHAASAVTLP